MRRKKEYVENRFPEDPNTLRIYLTEKFGMRYVLTQSHAFRNITDRDFMEAEVIRMQNPELAPKTHAVRYKPYEG